MCMCGKGEESGVAGEVGEVGVVRVVDEGFSGDPGEGDG